MRIQAPKMDGNKFCGPAVISAATGCTSGEAARLIRAVNRKTQVKGTHVSELAKAFARFRSQDEVEREIDRLIRLAARKEESRDGCAWESPEYWRFHDEAIKYHERARRLMPRGS